MGRLGDFEPLDQTPTGADQALVNIQAEGLDPNYQGTTARPQPSWILPLMIAIAVWFLIVEGD
jgi:hypothetical protein